MGGKCNGGVLVQQTFDTQLWVICKDCHLLDWSQGIAQCQALEGLEKLTLCPELQDFIRYHEIRLYGENADETIENPRRRKKCRR